MNPSAEYASFLIRLWREPSAESEAITPWHGEITHVQSGACRTLDGLAALVAFLREQSGDPRLLSEESRIK
ncbi:MAG: hypothetical protein AB1750_20035 [Chloroflexota bacterium]